MAVGEAALADLEISREDNEVEDHQQQLSRPMPAVPFAATPGLRPVIRVRKLCKNYYMGNNVVSALRGVSIDIERGDFVAIMGPSGSGKSTLMNLLGCLDRPTSGEYLLDGVSVSQMDASELADIRNQKIGFIFQGFNLLARMSALENVALPLVYSGLPAAKRHERAMLALSMVGLAGRAKHRPAELSGGQQQRVAVARALVTRPSLILADEPTGNLDSQTGLEVMMILQRLHARGITIVLVTHDPGIASYCRRQIKFRDGRVVEDSINAAQVFAHEQMLQNGHTGKKQVTP